MDSSTKTAMVCDNSSLSGDVVIPPSVTYQGETYNVTSIGMQYGDMTSITIPYSITSFKGGQETFSYCSGLTSIVWNVKSCDDFHEGYDLYHPSNNPFYYIRDQITSFKFGDSVDIIPADLCYGMEKLTSITIPNGVTDIGNDAFSGCTGLTSVTISNSGGIGHQAFEGCTGLTSVIISNSVTYIGYRAFEGCTGLTSVTIPNSVTSIGGRAFEGCTGLASITIPNSVTSIGGNVFISCSRLISVEWNAKACKDMLFYSDNYDPFYGIRAQITSFTFGESVDTIPIFLCCDMEKLTSITISNSVTYIGYRAFEGCTGLTSVTIPNSVTSIGYKAFYGCAGLTSVTIGNSVTSIGGSAFEGCTGLTSLTIPDGVTSIGEDAFRGCTGLTSATIGNSVTRIRRYAFCGCTGLTSITIGNGVTSIGENAFRGCTSLTSVVWNARNCSNFNEEDTPFYVKKRSYYDYDKGDFDIRSQITSFIFGDSVQRIPAWLCSGMRNLDSVTIPNSVTSIGESAFRGCLDITSVTIGNGVTSIGYEAFYGCTGLASITIPNSVTSIGDKAFTGGLWISSIIVEHGNSVYDSRDSCNAIIETATNTLIQGCRKTIIPNSITSIGEYAFYNCLGLTSVAIPNSVTEIGESAFSDCFLQSVFINSNTIHIEENAFDYCQSLIIGEDVKKIRAPYAFSQRLKKIYIRAETPPTILYLSSSFSSAFSDVPPYIPVYIPCGTKATYQLASGWQEFTNLIESKGITLTITTQNEQLGKVKIIKDGTSCSESESVFEAIANEGYIFSHWSDGNTDNPRHLVPTQDTVIVAQFRGIRSYTVNVDCNPEQGSVSGSGIYAETEPVTLTATANTGYRFSRWSDGNTDNPRTLTLTSDTTLTAEFVEASFLVTATTSHGSVTGTGYYNYGDEAVLTVNTEIGYRFTQWEDGNIDNPRTIIVTQDTSLTAQCKAVNHTITATCNPQQGNVIGGGTYADGAQVTLAAIANKGYEFTQWSNGVTDNPYLFTATEDLTLEAQFIPTTAVESVHTDGTTPQKVFRDGQVYILRDGKTYTLTGEEVK